jgi:hypothetical protein
MLRRTPTAITLTTEDIAIYEDARAREALIREQALAQSTPNAKMQNKDPNGGLKNGDMYANGQVKTRAERLGLGGPSRN